MVVNTNPRDNFLEENKFEHEIRKLALIHACRQQMLTEPELETFCSPVTMARVAAHK